MVAAMDSLKDLLSRYAKPGQIDWIGLRPVRLEPPNPVTAVEILTTGLVGDHGRKGKRAVTLIQAEHLPVIAACANLEAVAPETLRRNLVISGINLSAMRGRKLRLGTALVEITVPCAPCSRMEAALGKGGYAAMRGHGGWCATVLEPGRVALGDAVAPLNPKAPA